ncbi:MAG: type IV toxin-antitoxin system AbiEi family antitoxin domain-containing protein [Solirubrobacterales bacterium]
MELAELAAGQYGVVTIGQLLSLGYSKQAVARAVGAGRLHRLHQGVYAVGHTDLSLHGKCLAAAWGCGRGALLSHWSAAWLWGLMATRPLPIHVTTPSPRRARLGLVIHRSRTFADEDAAVVEEVPVTSVARTALDLAARVRRSSVRRLLQRTEELGVFDLPDFESILARNRGHRGIKPLRRELAVYKPPPFTRSGLEERFFELVLEHRLPRPATNYVEAGYELDAYWPELRFAVELDVYETHGSRLSFEEDRLRHENLKLAGVEMIRVTGPRLDREPRRVLDRIACLLEMRNRELASGRSHRVDPVRRPDGGR